MGVLVEHIIDVCMCEYCEWIRVRVYSCDRVYGRVCMGEGGTVREGK